MVEFGLASLVLFAILFGTIEFGLATWRYNMVADLAQEGARWAAVRGKDSDNPASSAAVQSFVQGRSPGFDVAVTTSAAPSSLSAGESVTVNVVATYSPITPLIPASLLTMQSTAKMIVAR